MIAIVKLSTVMIGVKKPKSVSSDSNLTNYYFTSVFLSLTNHVLVLTANVGNCMGIGPGFPKQLIQQFWSKI